MGGALLCTLPTSCLDVNASGRADKRVSSPNVSYPLPARCVLHCRQEGSKEDGSLSATAPFSCFMPSAVMRHVRSLHLHYAYSTQGIVTTFHAFSHNVDCGARRRL